MKISRKIIFIASVILTTMTLSACGGGSSSSSETMEETRAVGTIVDEASMADIFTTLVTAITAAGLVETLSGEGPFTVFAPTDEAFAALPEGVVEALLLPKNKKVLTQILTYHVVPGKFIADEVIGGDVETVEGQTVKLSTAQGVTINESTVIQADIQASNGVIHAIDTVILPPGVDVASLSK